METVRITRDEAQALAVIAQRLDRRPFRRRPTTTDIIDVVRDLGTIQLDTISVISRSHETVLWSRLGPYDLDLVTDLYVAHNALTEYVGHAASILPIDLLPLFRPHMERVRAHHGGWVSRPESQAIMRAVLDQIEIKGPMTSRDFEAPAEAERSQQWEWWGNKPERRALASLWLRGDVMVRKRDRGFARYFDLPDRVLPGFWSGQAPSVEVQQRELVQLALSALGVTTARWASDYFRTGGQAHVSVARTRVLLKEFTEHGIAIPIEVPGIDEPMWMNAALHERLHMLRERKGRPTLTTLLSPFDNLIWNRLRGEQLWGFFYRLECYVPGPKRQFGYYSLPILHRGQIIGRLDPSYNRRTGVLTIKSLHLEHWVRASDALARAVAGAIEDLLMFLGGKPGSWVMLKSNPAVFLELVHLHAGHTAITEGGQSET